MSNAAMTVDLVDARQSSTDRDWLSNIYPFYLHDLSEFDDGYYRLRNDGRWDPDYLPSWLADNTDYPYHHANAARAGWVRSGEHSAKPAYHAGRRLSTVGVLRAPRLPASRCGATS